MPIPIPQFELDLPGRLVNSDRLHARIVRECVREELMAHWRNRIPGHFNRSATQKYRYAPRVTRYRRRGPGGQKTISYAAWKQQKFGSNSDLVKTGRSRHAMTTQSKITIGGTASIHSRKAPGINGQLRMRFPFPGGTGARRKPNSKDGVDIAQMIREVSIVLPQESREMSESLADRYVTKVVSDTSRRQRMRI